MSEFHNPYNFVPIDEVSSEKWEQIENGVSFCHSLPHSHSRYDPQRLHGRVLCAITVETPLVVGNRQEKSANSAQPGRVKPFELNKKPAIPGTSLRGMLSALAEAASGSALRVLSNTILTFRKAMNAEEALSALGMLRKDDEGNWHIKPLTLPTLTLLNGAYEIPDAYRRFFPSPSGANLKVLLDNPSKAATNCSDDGQLEPLYWTELKKISTFSTFSLPATPALRCAKQGTAPFAIGRTTAEAVAYLFPKLPLRDAEDDCEFVRGILRKLSMKGRDLPNTRYHEVFIPYPEDQLEGGYFSLRKEVVEKFVRLASERSQSKRWDENAFAELLPYHPVNTRQPTDRTHKQPTLELRTGDVVFFKAEGTGATSEITEISFSSIWRDWVATDTNGARLAPSTVHDFFTKKDGDESSGEILPFHPSRTRVSPAEWLFGFVENRTDTKLGADLGRLGPKGTRFHRQGARFKRETLGPRERRELVPPRGGPKAHGCPETTLAPNVLQAAPACCRTAAACRLRRRRNLH
jgi:hypothetical protein